MPFSKKSRSQLAQQFAEIFQEVQDEYRFVLGNLRDDDVDAIAFEEQVDELCDRLLRLKRIRLQLRHERDEIVRLSGRDEAA